MPHSTACRCAATLLLVTALNAVATPTPAADTKPMHVLSFNVRYDNPSDGPNRWPQRKEAVAKIIDRADVAGLQEVLHRQLVDLRKSLPEFTAVGVGRDDGKQAGEYSPILYRTARFELRESGTFWLSETPDKIGSRGWDASLPRICTWAHLADKQSEQTFFVFNTHFDHRGAEARRESGKLIASKVAELAGTAPAMLTGDFNATPESEPIQAILAAGDAEATRLKDSRTLSKADPVGPNTTWNGFSKIVENRRIDFVFVRPQVEVLSYEEITDQIEDGRFPSDHLPVMVKVGLTTGVPSP